MVQLKHSTAPASVGVSRTAPASVGVSHTAPASVGVNHTAPASVGVNGTAPSSVDVNRDEPNITVQVFHFKVSQSTSCSQWHTLNMTRHTSVNKVSHVLLSFQF